MAPRSGMGLRPSNSDPTVWTRGHVFEGGQQARMNAGVEGGGSEALARRFRHFAREQARGRSRLYECLANAIAGRPAVALVLFEAPAEQRRPTLLFAAVHDLLLGGTDHPLADYYPSLGGWREPDEELLETFDAFCAAHDDVLRSMMSTRMTQTNEVRRSAALLPALQEAERQARAPLALVEVGASAGLNLVMDRFAFRYGDRRVGAADTKLVVHTSVSNGRPPPILGSGLSSQSRIGIDLRPLDVGDPSDVRWLRACVWPDDLDRLRLLDEAVAVVRNDPPPLAAGHALEALPKVVAALPYGADLCVFHSSTLAYFSDVERRRFVELLASLSMDRSVWWVSLEAPFIEPFNGQALSAFEAGVEGLTYLIALSRLEDGRRVCDMLLGRSDPHGKWIEWVAR